MPKLPYVQQPLGGGITPGSVASGAGAGANGLLFAGYKWNTGFSLNNSAAETALGSGVTIPAGTLFAGGAFLSSALLRVRMAGRVGTTGTPTLRWRLYLGGIGGATMFDHTFTLPNNSAGAVWSLDCDSLAQVDTVPTAGRLSNGTGSLMISGAGPTLVGQTQPNPAIGPVLAVTLDFTTALTVIPTFQFSAASPSNVVTLDVLTAQILYPLMGA